MRFDFSFCFLRNDPFRRATASLTWSMLLLLGVVSSTAALAQFAKTDTIQRALAAKPAPDQAVALAEIVRKAWPDRKCSLASASLEQTYDNGNGGWLVTCDGESDYWIVVPTAAAAATVTPCALAPLAGLSCYANLRTVASEHITDCDVRSNRTDPVIRSCTVIIQSDRLTSRPDALAIAYVARAVAYSRYGQNDLALRDFDEAVSLQPNNIDYRFNRAVALERNGKFDQAIADLDKVLVAKPDNWNASYERGYVFMQKGSYDRAIDDFDQVLRINPGFEKAARQRASALQAKQNAKVSQGVQPKSTIVDTSGPGSSDSKQTITEVDQKAAYCMEATFGLLQRETKFIQLLKQNQDKVRALQQQTGLSESDRSKVQEGLKGLDGRIAQSEANRVKWDGNLKKFIEYLQQHGLISQVSAMSAKAADDQRAVQETYRDCLRTCNSGDESCRQSCDKSAEASEASKRMKQCDQVAKDIQ